MFHIATNETFLIDAPAIKSKCLVCNQVSLLRIGWLGEKCDICGSCIDVSEVTRRDVARLRRKLLKLNRPQMGALTGYSKTTIKHYEYIHCSKPYFDKTTELMNSKFNTQPQTIGV